jgi:hypothetical protein
VANDQNAPAVTAPANEVPETTKSQVVVRVITHGVSSFRGSPDGKDENLVEVKSTPTVVASKTLAGQLIELAAAHGVKIAYVEVEK